MQAGDTQGHHFPGKFHKDFCDSLEHGAMKKDDAISIISTSSYKEAGNSI